MPARSAAARSAVVRRAASAVTGGVRKPPVARRRAPKGRPVVPGHVWVDGPTAYVNVRLTNGVRVHVFGERHTTTSTCSSCRAPGCVTMGRYVADMYVAALHKRGKLDVFLETEIDNPATWVQKGWRQSDGLGWHDRPADAVLHDMAPLMRLKFQMGDTVGRGGTVRAHRIDIRDGDKHPLLHARGLMTASYGVREAVSSDDFMRVMLVVLDSDGYSRDLVDVARLVGRRFRSAEAYRAKYPRNATSTTTHADVSRVRKALLKLPPQMARRIRDAAVRFAKGKGQFYGMAVLMDVYAVSRVLYYAGYGTERPPDGTSWAQVAMLGAWHVDSWRRLLLASGAVAAVTGPGRTSCVSAPDPRGS